MNRNLTALLELARNYEHQLPDLQLPVDHPDTRPFAAWIDHTLLKPDATPEQIERLCAEAREHQFATVCINPIYIPQAYRLLEGSRVEVCTVVGFPLGATLMEAKADETRFAIDEGATEIDMVIPIGLVKGGRYEAAADDVQRIVDVAHPRGAKVKVILEMTMLTRFEKIAGCLISRMSGADFVKTSTGFGPGGAKLEDVELMRRVVGLRMDVKAAGGIRSYEDARAMLEAGATRLGTSAGVRIVQEAQQEVRQP